MSTATDEPAQSSSESDATARTRIRWQTIAGVVLLALTLVYVGRSLAGQWSAVRAAARDSDIAWHGVLLASIIVLATHAALVQAWRLLLAGWDDPPPFWASVRVWTVANLGRYLPGKLWSIGALSMLAREQGVSGIAAASAAILGTVLNLGAGVGILAIGGAAVFAGSNAALRGVAVVCSVLFVAGVLALPMLLPPVVNWIARRRGLPPVDRHLSARTLWTVTVINVAAWLGYGAAFALLASAVSPSITGEIGAFITVYTASYLWGYLVLFAPGGIGVREKVLVSLLVALGMSGQGDAWFLALASRAWISLLEVAPGLIALFFRRPEQRPR